MAEAATAATVRRGAFASTAARTAAATSAAASMLAIATLWAGREGQTPDLEPLVACDVRVAQPAQDPELVGQRVVHLRVLGTPHGDLHRGGAAAETPRDHHPEAATAEDLPREGDIVLAEEPVLRRAHLQKLAHRQAPGLGHAGEDRAAADGRGVGAMLRACAGRDLGLRVRRGRLREHELGLAALGPLAQERLEREPVGEFQLPLPNDGRDDGEDEHERYHDVVFVAVAVHGEAHRGH
mmetsp:Transcript_49181/g.138848  ORF Transcript_49181/g.138848 Transcript_49181/m.138848 type:complete len:239 (+) Transcript_49181:834-1550(+)